MRTTSSLFRKGTLRTFQQNKIEKTFALFKIVLYFCTNGLVKATLPEVYVHSGEHSQESRTVHCGCTFH